MKRNMNMHEILTEYWPRMPKEEVQQSCDRIWKRIQEGLNKRDTSLRSLYGDGWTAVATTQWEFRVLAAISELGDRPDINQITDAVEEWTGGCQIARVVVTLQELDEKKLIKVHRSASSRTDRDWDCTYSLSEDGSRALRRAHREGKELVAESRWSVKHLVKEALRIKS
jgi:DNA-binding PadR family transcriptional regulator